jgi:predicted nucleic acid-binding protein
MQSVYLETTVPSYLAAMASRDLIIAAHQKITHDWWQTANERFDLYISEAVLAELREGDQEAVKKRSQIIEHIPVLAVNEDIRTLTFHYLKNLGLSGKAQADIPHFAFAVSYEMDYLVTWNCSHIANGQIIKRLADVNTVIKRPTPIIVTPEELIELPED